MTTAPLRMPHEFDGDGYGSRPRRSPFLPLWWFGNLMAWLGGGHWRDIADRQERTSYQLAGLFVLLNSFIAWGVATFAAVGITATTFESALPYTIPWGIFVGAFDRTIAGYVPQHGAAAWQIRRVMATRVAMAVLLGVLIGEFANLWFFRNPIDQQVLLNVQNQTVEVQAAVESSQGELRALYSQRDALDGDIRAAEGRLETATVALNCEIKPQDGCPPGGTVTGDAGDGPQAARRRQERDQAQRDVDDARAKRAAVQVWVPAQPGEPAAASTTLDLEIDRLEADKQGELDRSSTVVAQNTGIDARWEAMHQYTLRTPSAMLLRIVVLVALISIDLVPLAAKLMRGHTGNDDRMRLRRDLLFKRNNVQRVQRTRELDDVVTAHAHRQYAELESVRLREQARVEQIQLALEADRTIVAERERLRAEVESERLQRQAKLDMDRPPSVAPESEPDPVPPRQATAAEMVSSQIPDWWSQRDLGLLNAVIGGRFRVVGPLRGSSRGSFGRMLVAQDLEAERRSDSAFVVVKAVPLPTDESSGVRGAISSVLRTTPGRMWQKEIAAAGALHHRAIGRIIDHGEHDGYVWTAAPYYSPGSLMRWVEQQEAAGEPLQLGQLLKFAEEIAGALDVAHASPEHVVHGDLKPDNVVLNGPQAVVIDWGLARLVDRTGSQRSTGLPRGTRFFGAPELFTGRRVSAGPYGPYVDLWSLGATMYRLLTGESPLERDTEDVPEAEEVAAMAISGEIRVAPLDELFPGLPREVVDVVHQLLSIDAAQRSTSAEPRRAAGELRRHLAWISEVARRREVAELPVGLEAAKQARSGDGVDRRRFTPSKDGDEVDRGRRNRLSVTEPEEPVVNGDRRILPSTEADVPLPRHVGVVTDDTDDDTETAPIHRVFLPATELEAPAGGLVNGRRPPRELTTEPGPGIPPP